MSSGDRIQHIGTFYGQKMNSLALLVGLLALLIAAGCGGSNSAVKNTGGGGTPAEISSTISVGTAPSSIAVDSMNNKIYVTDFGTTPTGTQGCSASGADVTAIDGATQSTTSVGFWFAIFTPMNPFAMTLDASNHTFYVLTHEHWSGIKRNGNCGLLAEPLEVFDATTLQQTSDRFDAGGTGIGVNPTTGTVYVARPGGSVDVWDSTWNLLATVPVGTSPVGVAVNTTSNKIYVANSGSNNISVIDSTSNSVLGTVADPHGLAPAAVAVNPTTNTIYAVNSQSNNVTVIDGATDTVTATIPVGTSPSGAAVDSQTNFIYVANAGNSQTGDPGNVTVINGSTNATNILTDPNAKYPVAVGVNSATNKIYVANSGSNNVTVIDGAH